MKIKDMLNEEKPREKLSRLGVESLSDSELLSIILRTGNKNESVNELSTRILKSIGGVKNLKEMTLHTLTQISGVKLSKASTILASFELAKRSLIDKEKILFKSTSDMFNYVRGDFVNARQEKFLILLFDNKFKLIKKCELFKGTINTINVHPREVFREAIKESTSFIILIHNHPSGDVTPSEKDDEVTSVLVKTGNIIGIKVIDHLVVSSDKYYSYYENAKKKI